MTKMLVKSMKYRINYDKELYKILDDINYATFRLKNWATMMAHDWQSYSFSYHDRFEKYPKEKDVLGAVLTTDINRRAKEQFPEFLFMGSRIFAEVTREAISYYKTWSKEIASGSMTVPSYRRNGSFPLRAQSINDIQKVKSGLYSAKLSLLSNSGKKEYGLKKGQIEVELFGSRRGGSINSIIEKVIEGEYSLADSKIMKNNKGQYMLLMAYKFPQQEVIVDKDKIMGIDLGIAVPATISVSNDNWYYQFVGSAQEIRDFERQVDNRRRRLSRSRKWAGEGVSGRGRDTRVKAVDKLGNKIANFKDTKNHQWSKFIVDEAVKLGVGKIQMEDLTGMGKNSNKDNDLFLKRWTFYDLQSKIEYKAKEYGIEVVKVKPAYTSARCSHCGHIHLTEDKKEWRPTQDKFKCVACEKEMNADVNASRNIAIRDIDLIIEKEIKEYKKLQERLDKLKEV